ncbi:MAG: OmpA family protein [Candidatus Latescibacteria bacterium]|nr:OmpA family protein [Candidatus Latescibacterota bacterium]
MKRTAVLVLVTALIVGNTIGCALSSKVKGGMVGAGTGGAVGGLVGKKLGNTALGAIVGAAVGGSAGVLIGKEMDQRAEEMRQDMQGAKIERVGEGIKITFGSGLLFDVNKADLQSEAKANLDNFARILGKYSDTNILVEGDTDNTGGSEYNQKLSERRAQSVANYLIDLGVAGSRISTVGLGEDNPVAENDTDLGRQQNRRVEVAIFANEKLKKAAEAGELN